MPLLSALDSCPNRHGNNTLGRSSPTTHRETAGCALLAVSAIAGYSSLRFSILYGRT